MALNPWTHPEGFAVRPPRVRYRVRDAGSGEMVCRMTSLSVDFNRGGHYFHALDHHDLHLAKKAAAILQRACAYFYERDDARYVPLKGVPGLVIPDAEVRERIRRMDEGENAREAERANRKRYVLTALPWDQQRALVEQTLALYRAWSFEWQGEATREEEEAYAHRPPPTRTRTPGDDAALTDEMADLYQQSPYG